VTPPSIYLHFADKDALLDAVCARYFEKLDEEMWPTRGRSAVDDRRAARAGPGLRSLRGETPELYRIAMMGEAGPQQRGHGAEHLSVRAHAHLGRGADHRRHLPQGDATTLALELWTVTTGSRRC